MRTNPAPAADVDVDPDFEERDDAIIATALKWSLVGFALLAAIVGGLAYWMWPQPPREEIRQTELAAVDLRERPQTAIPRVRFTDVTDEAGIRFVHQNAANGQKLLPETMGGGCAFFDYDDDGDQDLLLVNSLRRWPWDDRDDQSRATTALYQNDGRGRFQDVSAESGLDASFYGMGAAVADYDADGYVDVFLSGLGESRLFHNEGNGTFVDVTKDAGVGGAKDAWSTSCGWFDYDNDGDLDLFVCNYLTWSREYDESQNFQLTGGGRAYGRPQNFEGSLPYLYRNDGDGRFAEVAKRAGLHVLNRATRVPVAKSLGVIFSDVDLDGWFDVIVANDTVQNFLFHNEGNGRFREIGEFTGVAFDMNGNARGAMGIDAARFRNNDALGIVISNFSNEMTALYVSYGDLMQFMDEAISTGIGPSSRLELKFGIFFFDYDLDGRLDVITANGHLEEDINRVQPSQHYEQPPHLFWNCGSDQDTEFVAVKAEHCGQDLMRPLVGRGAAYADIDNDGDLDVLITAVGQRPRLLRNDQDVDHHWLRFELTGAGGNRDAIGASIEVELDGVVLRRDVSPTRSYLSQVELPVSFGLGAKDAIGRITVHWPDGSQQNVVPEGVDRIYEVVQDVVDAPSEPRPATASLSQRTSP